MQPGRVRTSSTDDPIVMVEAGNVPVAAGRYFARYLVDRTTETCWLMVAESVARLDCCEARRAEPLRELITWETAEGCDGR
jgi:hypothetical protein